MPDQAYPHPGILINLQHLKIYMKQFENKVVIVTGGGKGIGQTTAFEFAREGAIVVIANRNDTEGRETAEHISQSGGKASFIKTDVTKETEVKNLVDLTMSTYGRIDYAFNNAGVEQPPMPLTEQTEELFDRVMNVNVKSVWLCMKHQIPAMLKSGGGSIVNTSSFSGVIALATKLDVANTVVFLCSDKAAFITGQSILVDGGYTAG
jgi:NAD(P)-dependent dehydrogenase (short-subunit alcohol dehydrogenase family)